MEWELAVLSLNHYVAELVRMLHRFEFGLFGWFSPAKIQFPGGERWTEPLLHLS